MRIRRAEDTDQVEVYQVHLAAFGQTVEADLNRSLHSGGHVPEALSLVAEVDGTIVGHVVCSRGQLGDTIVMGLGPIGVLPEHQRTGVGSALMQAVIDAADTLGEPMLVLLGSPDYYSRFGFVSASELDVEAPDPEWGKYFQALALHQHDPTLTGRYQYAPPFDELS